MDLGTLANRLLAQHDVHRIRYFTALVAARDDDPSQPQRQQAYLRALRTVPNLSIHYGQLRPRRKRRPLAGPPAGGPRTAEFLDTEEKGSDVNLTSYLLMDGFEDDYELAVLISNDSDLKLPIELARTRLNKQVGVFDPSGARSTDLRNAASWYRPLRRGALRASQFAETLSDGSGVIRRPAGW